MHLPEQWSQAFQDVSGSIALKVNTSTGDNGLPGGQELSDLLRNVVTSGGEINIILSS